MKDQIVRFTLYQSTYDNRIMPENNMEAMWKDFVGAVQEFTITDDKDSMMLISPVEYEQEDECYVPAKYTHNESLKTPEHNEGEIKVNKETGKPYVWKGADNVLAWYMLPIDIDGEMTIEEAKERFAEYEYVAYTSHSHKTEKKGFGDCFRLFLLLREPVSAEDFASRTVAIEKFMNGDATATALARGFYLPSCSAVNKDKKQSWYNEGEALDLLSFAENVIPEYTKTEYETDITDEVKKYVLEKLATEVHINSYDPWWKVAAAMYESGYSYEEFQYATIGRMMSSKSESDCRKQWAKSRGRAQRGKAPGFGYLVNVVGGLKPFYAQKNNMSGNDKAISILSKIGLGV